jgi:hypothetical protein
MFKSIQYLACMCLGLFVSLPASADVMAPRVTTDQSVDTHDAASIVASVCKPGMSDEGKAVAIYEFVRRAMFHYEQRGEKNDQVYDLDAIFQHNMFARPFLAAGKNTVTVRTANPETLDHDKFFVTYVWQEAGQEKRDSRRITESPTTYGLEVGGQEMPRMVRLEMSVMP